MDMDNLRASQSILRLKKNDPRIALKGSLFVVDSFTLIVDEPNKAVSIEDYQPKIYTTITPLHFNGAYVYYSDLFFVSVNDIMLNDLFDLEDLEFKNLKEAANNKQLDKVYKFFNLKEKETC